MKSSVYCNLVHSVHGRPLNKHKIGKNRKVAMPDSILKCKCDLILIRDSPWTSVTWAKQVMHPPVLASLHSAAQYNVETKHEMEMISLLLCCWLGLLCVLGGIANGRKGQKRRVNTYHSRLHVVSHFGTCCRIKAHHEETKWALFDMGMNLWLRSLLFAFVCLIKRLRNYYSYTSLSKWEVKTLFNQVFELSTNKFT